MADSKVSFVRAAMASGDWARALALAARFPRLGVHRAAILDGHTALSNPRFAVALHRDVAADVAAGRLALCAAYGEKGFDQAV